MQVPVGERCSPLKMPWGRKRCCDWAEGTACCTCVFGIPVECSLVMKEKNAWWSRACFIVSQTQSTFWCVYLSRQGRGLAWDLHRFAVDNKTGAGGDVLWCKSLKHTHSFKCTKDISVVSVPSSSSLSVIICLTLITSYSRFSNNFSLIGRHNIEFYC